MKILVRSPNWIGDQILAYPFFYYLKKAFPNAQITSLCHPRVSDIQYRGLVNRVISIKKPTSRSLTDRVKAIDLSAKEAVRETEYDLAFTLPNSFSSAFLLSKTKAKIRIGYATEFRSLFLNHKVKWEGHSGIHRSQAYVNLLYDFLKKAPPKTNEFWGEWTPDFQYIDNGECKEFDHEANWNLEDSQEIPNEKYFILGPGATATSRRWFTRSYAQLAELIYKEFELKPVIVGGPQEAPLADELIGELGLSAIDRAGKGTIPSLANLFRHAEFCVTNESGLAHISSFLSCPTFIVCGAADPRRTKPTGPGSVKVVVNPVECWPCEKNVCYQEGEKHLQCLKGIHANRIFEEIRNAIESKA